MNDAARSHADLLPNPHLAAVLGTSVAAGREDVEVLREAHRRPGGSGLLQPDDVRSVEKLERMRLDLKNALRDTT